MHSMLRLMRLRSWNLEPTCWIWGSGEYLIATLPVASILRCRGLFTQPLRYTRRESQQCLNSPLNSRSNPAPAKAKKLPPARQTSSRFAHTLIPTLSTLMLLANCFPSRIQGLNRRLDRRQRVRTLRRFRCRDRRIRKTRSGNRH